VLVPWWPFQPGLIFVDKDRLWIRNLRKNYKLLSKLVHFSKPVKVTDNNRDTLAYYVTELIMAITALIVQASPGAPLR
jgi:hypothetical protein